MMMSPDDSSGNPPHAHPTRAEVAIHHLMHGRACVPVPSGLKGPVHTGWNKEIIGLPDLDRRFAGDGNIGILLGEPSGGLVDVDLDCPEAIELADSILPPTDAVTGRTSTPRSHRWYIAHGAVTEQFRDPVTDDMIVEIRSTGVQTLVGPSVHPETGERYDLLLGVPAVVDAAALVVALAAIYEAVVARRYPEGVPAKAATRPIVGHAAANGPRVPTRRDDDHVLRRAKAYLARMPAAISGQGGHGRTYAAATCMVHGFGLEPDVAFDLLWSQYNPRCEPPWSEREMQHKIDDAAMKAHALPYGWLRDAPRTPGASPSDVLVHGEPSPSTHDEHSTVEDDESHADDEPRDQGPLDPGPFPQHLLDVPGFIGEVMAYNLATAHRRAPLLALGAAITLQAVLAARKVRDERGNRTSIYIVAVAPSGAGKDHPRKVSRKILEAAGLTSLEGPEELASDAGLISAVEACPGILFQIDEIGRFLKTTSDPSASAHLYGIAGSLIKLYSAVNTTFKGKAYADPGRNKSIIEPCVSLYGSTVPQHFFEALTPHSLSDGLLARGFILESGEVAERQRVRETEPSGSIIAIARWWGTFQPGGNLGAMKPQPQVISTDDDGHHVFGELAAHVDLMLKQSGAGCALWARAEEQACRLALVYACSANHLKPVIDHAAASWACQFTRYTIERTLYLAEAWVARNDFESRQKEIVRIIKSAGRRISRSVLCRKTQWLNKRERTDLIDNMLETGLIRVVPKNKTGGRPGLFYETV